ncbi:MAG TPA: YbaK/EbsC family protein, partial [Candidatus Eisenbacteria bacterium]|nr:YbaK/EbsC family protein [Candidatus Eisenbacteria bacterium]
RPLSAAAQRVQDALRAGGFANAVLELESPVRTAAAAAAAVGCEPAQIVKSLVFRTAGGRGVLVVASGAGRVSEASLAALVGEPVAIADPPFVRAATGYAIGGIPPLGHATPLDTFVDARLLALDSLWAAAGHPNSLFRLTPAELVRMTGGRVAEVGA